MAETEKTVYRLFALPLTTHNISVAAQHRFSRATPSPAPGYVLIYTDGEKPMEATEITSERVNLLSPADERWLFDSNAALIAEQIAQRPQDFPGGIAESIDALEAALKKQKENLDKKGA